MASSPAPTPTDRARRLVEAFRAGKRPALARAISIVEDERPHSDGLLHDLLGVPPRARRFGFTGPPGAGKSSLTAAVAARLRERGEDVAIVAVDPTSPFSGGALLGDRIRMNDLATDRGVFIRSMATRGSLGGLAAATREAVDLLDAFGFANVLVESVGVGQTELQIASAVDSVAVVLVPESGDGVQAMKAGLMEIADVFVVNKSDRPGADRLVRDVRQALRLRAGNPAPGAPSADDPASHARPSHQARPPHQDAPPHHHSTPSHQDVPPHHGVDLSALRAPREAPSGSEESPWAVPVLKTSAGRDEGVDELLERLMEHHRHATASGRLAERRRARARARIRDVVDRRLRARAAQALASEEGLDQWAPQVAAGRATAYQVANKVVDAILKDAGANG